MIKKRQFRIISLVMTLALIFSNLVGIDGLVKVRAAAGDKVFDIVEITDFHGQLLSADATPLPVGAVLAQNVKNIKSANPDRTLVIGGGDLYQGTPVSNVLKGVPVQKVLSSIGMEVTALGNHEFDWGGLSTVNNETMKDASYSIVSANLYDKTTNQRVYEPYKIITKDGVKIAVIGAISTETPSIVMPAYVANYNFKDPVTEIKAVANDIKNNHLADVILVDIHEGNDTANSSNGPITGPIAAIADGLVGVVNAVFAGHSHTEVHALSSKGMPIYIAKSNGKGIIDVKMTVSSDGTVSFPTPSSSNYIALDNTNANGYKAANPIQDPAAKAIIDAAVTEVGPTFNEVIGNIPADLNRTQVGSPYGESQLGNWASDVVKNNAKADIGVANNGGLRTNFSAGDITVGQVFNFMPFDNEINTVKVNYAQLKAILEQAVMNNGKGIQVSGIKFYYDPARPNLNRVYNITREDGSPIKATDSLTLAGPDFVLTGGDGFIAFTDSAVKATLVNTHVLARDAFIADIRANKTINVVMDNRIVNAPFSGISIVGTSDLHGAIYPMDYNTGAASNVGLARISTYVKNLRTSNSNTMLIDDGDTIQGTPLVYYYNMIDQNAEYPMMKVMGAMGYDTWTLGNHEFNYGLTTLNRVIADANKNNIQVLSANTYKTSDNSNFVNPYYVKNLTISGKTVKVGILGLTTKTIPSWEDPAHYAGLQFNDLVTEAQKWVPIMRNQEKCDVVIVAAHTGTSNASDTIPENQADLIAKNVSGIDAILAGHAHTGKTYSFTNPDGKVVPVIEPKNGDGIFSQIDISIDANGNIGAINSNNAYDVDTSKDNALVADQAILDIAKPYQDATLAYTNTVIGQSTGEFTGAGQLTGPTAIMELINKVQANAAGAQLSIAAPLSASARIPQGDIKRQDIMGVYVYENFLYGVNMTGKQLKDWMEWSVRYYKQVSSQTDPIIKDAVLNIADYNLDQLYGATYDIDLTQPVGNRIKNLKFNGKLINDTEVFKVAINNYRYNGGGGFMAAAGLIPGSAATTAATYYDSAKALGDDGQVRNMMFKYVQDNKVISPTNSNNWKAYTTFVPQEVGGVTLNNDKLDLRVGNCQTLVADIFPANATNKTVLWTSSNNKVATVDGNGFVTAIGKGTATITVTTIDGGYKATATVTVSNALAGIELGRTTIDLKLGHSEKLTATLVPEDIEIKDGIWESSNPAVVSVNNGVVTALTYGDAVVSVKTKDGKYQASIIIHAIEQKGSSGKAS